MVHLSASEIKLEISEAFSGVKRLPDSELFLDEYDYLWTESFIGGTEEWKELSSKAILHEYSALRSVTPKGFQFLIPAYMSCVLENANSPSNTPDHVVYALNVSTHSPGFFEIFSVQQSIAICTFLLWATAQKDSLDHIEAEKSLNSYWVRFNK